MRGAHSARFEETRGAGGTAEAVRPALFDAGASLVHELVVERLPEPLDEARPSVHVERDEGPQRAAELVGVVRARQRLVEALEERRLDTLRQPGRAAPALAGERVPGREHDQLREERQPEPDDPGLAELELAVGPELVAQARLGDDHEVEVGALVARAAAERSLEHECTNSGVGRGPGASRVDYRRLPRCVAQK